MAGAGPFAWLSERGSPWGFHRIPRGGLCLSAFLFVRRGDEVLVGQYADDARWETLAGLDAERRRAHGRGWTLPASHLRWGEDPRDAATRVAEEHLQLRGLRLGDVRVENSFEPHPKFPEVGPHWDVWFFAEAEAPRGSEAKAPPWYRALAWKDPRRMRPDEWARSHEDVAERWLASR